MNAPTTTSAIETDSSSQQENGSAVATAVVETRSAAPRTFERPAAFRPYVAWAVLKRDFTGYFSNPAGYVFITLFVLISSWVAFCLPSFFADNLADLNTLNNWMPYLLLFFIPAVTMSIWAEERRQGTDELLLTLPVCDVEVVLGKYLAALGIYTVALVFSLSHVVVLRWLGNPDAGVLVLDLSRLLADGRHVDRDRHGGVALVVERHGRVHSRRRLRRGPGLHRLDRLVPGVFDDRGASARLDDRPATARHLQRPVDHRAISRVRQRGRDAFGPGLLRVGDRGDDLSHDGSARSSPLGRRTEDASHWTQSIVRVAAVALALGSVTTIVSRYANWMRWDASVEQLSSLSDETRSVLKSLKTDRPVVIQAYYSPEVPREYVTIKNDLLGKLREYAAIAGDKVRLNLVEVERFSPASCAAQKRFGIEPKSVLSMEEGKQSMTEMYLGVAFTSGLEEVVIPFFDKDLPVEYELTRSIRVVSRGKEEGRDRQHRRENVGRHGLRLDGPQHRMGVRHRVEEAIRRHQRLGRHRVAPRHASLDRAAAGFDDSTADRQPDEIRHIRRPRAFVTRPVPDGRSDDLAARTARRPADRSAAVRRSSRKET